MQPAPSRDSREDERARPRRDEAREQCLPDALRRDPPPCGRYFEQEEGCDQRASEECSDRREGP
jgi:hypothetical protein